MKGEREVCDYYVKALEVWRKIFDQVEPLNTEALG
jgi:hypothetical protein